MDEAWGKARQTTPLTHFARIEDPRDPARVRYPLPEVLLLVVAATIAGCDDYDEIAAWGESHVDVLRRVSEFYFGTPGEDWLRVVMNRTDPELFQACFSDWASGLRPESPVLIALDGKTSRRSHDRPRGQRALPLVSAWATPGRLVLAQHAVADKENECGAIPEILDRLDLNGALVTIDAIACNPGIAGAITERKDDYLLAVKANQPTLCDELKTYFDDPTPGHVTTLMDVDKGHGRIETRCYSVSHEVDWLTGQKRFPGEPRFPTLASIIMASSWWTPGSSKAAPRRPCDAMTSRPRHSRPSGPTRRSASRTACTGCSMSSSARIVPPAPRSRRPQHGHRPPFRPQSRAPRKRQTLHQDHAESCGLECR